MKRFYIDKVWIDDTCLWIETKDGRRMCTPFSKWKRTKEPVPMIRHDPFRKGLHFMVFAARILACRNHTFRRRRHLFCP